jgi:hypothetical protein
MKLTTGGCIVWGCAIAVYRVLFVKAQTWLKKTIGVRNMLFIIIFVGLVILFGFISIVFVFDNGPSYRICHGLSEECLNIMLDYQVNSI